jgi:membrane associated rhomboid family serine protease
LVNAGVSTADHIGGLVGGVLVAAVMTPARGATLRGDRDV